MHKIQNYLKHIFLIAETKGSMSSMDLSSIEKAKNRLCRKVIQLHFYSRPEVSQGSYLPRFDGRYECDTLIKIGRSPSQVNAQF